MSRLTLSAVALTAVVAALAPASARAATADKRTDLTFSAPVQIPGGTLSAGTYRFHLTSRSVLQVRSNDGAIVYATFNTRPDSRTSMTEGADVSFLEMPVGAPPAIKSIFFGGEYGGYEFVYPKGGPVPFPLSLKSPEAVIGVIRRRGN